MLNIIKTSNYRNKTLGRSQKFEKYLRTLWLGNWTEVPSKQRGFISNLATYNELEKKIINLWHITSAREVNIIIMIQKVWVQFNCKPIELPIRFERTGICALKNHKQVFLHTKNTRLSQVEEEQKIFYSRNDLVRRRTRAEGSMKRFNVK